MATAQNMFYNNVWEWRDESLINFKSNFNPNMGSSNSSKKGSVIQVGSGTSYDGHFRDTSSPHKQSEFYYHFRRKKLPNGPDVVTMQDVKNVIFYLSTGIDDPIFIKFFHSEQINPFLRSLVLYFDLFLKVWNDLMDRRRYKDSKLKHYTAQYRENNCKRTLCELRCKIGQCYAEIIAGEAGFNKYHHSKRSLNTDKLFFDTFTNYCSRFVWIALVRNQFSQIQTEMLRLFQSEEFYTMNLAIKNRKGLRLDLDEVNVIYGKDSSFIRSKYEKSHMYQTSPSIFDVVNRANEFKDDSFQLLNKEQMFSLKSIHFINGAIIIPEELLEPVQITLGLIGKPRKNFEPLLQVKEEENKFEVELGSVRFKSEKSQVLQPPTPAQQVFNVLNEFNSYKTFPKTVRVLGKNYSFFNAVSALTHEHEKQSKIAQMQWIKECCFK